MFSLMPGVLTALLEDQCLGGRPCGQSLIPGLSPAYLLSLVLVIPLPCLDVSTYPLSKASLDLCSLCVPNL